MMQIIRLSDRLKAIAGFIKEGASVADIGTDHGMIPVYLAQTGLARTVYASDISAGSLDAALSTAEKYGVADKINFIVAPGLDGIGDSEVDTVVITGLGGETIATILRDAPWTRHQRISLILQPQTKVAELCRYLRECGYTLRRARLADDNGKLYVVMLVSGGENDSSLEPEVELIARLMHADDPLLGRFLDELIMRAKRALEGMRDSASPELLEMALRLSVYVSMKEVHDNANSE